MNRTCRNTQTQDGFFQSSGQGDGELCIRIENDSHETVNLVPDRSDERRFWVGLLRSVTISKSKMSKYASQSSKLLGASQTQIP
jgi:hypothetical protein